MAEEPIHLKNRDRVAFAYRVAGASFGLVLIVVAFVTSSWADGWALALFGLVTVGGAFSYHLLTSVARCPTCGVGVKNFRISSDDSKKKVFLCGRCGTSAYLTEGFYWQSDVAG